jgi:hypothetical protein
VEGGASLGENTWVFLYLLGDALGLFPLTLFTTVIFARPYTFSTSLTMADAAAAPEPAAGGWDAWSIGKNIAIFVGIQFAVKQFTGGGGQKAAPAVTPDVASTGGSEPGAWSDTPVGLLPLWPDNPNVDVAMYVSPSVVLPPLSRMPAGSLVVQEKDFSLQGKDFREITTSISVPKSVQNNGTLWAHILIGQTGAELDPASPNYDPATAYRMLRPLTQYLGKKKVRKTRNLLDSKATEEEEAEEEKLAAEPTTVASYYHSNLTLSFISNAGPANYPSLHPAVKQFYMLEATGARDETGKNGWYYPLVYHNTFWQMKKDMVELNNTVPYETLPMNIHISTLANWQFSIMASMDEGMKETARKAAQGQTSPGGGDGSEMEMFKEVLLDSNMYLLGTTAIVSVLHMIFELLAFKSDVGHWRKKKDNVGISVRTILTNVVMQAIIFLYLLDNNENTSWMILFGQGMGIAIEFWKITKTVNVRVREPGPDSKFRGILPYVVVFEDKHKLSETEEKTDEYDKIAFKYMGMIAVPLLLAYAAYSLMYESHKSWYSFIITTLVGSVYAYGFLMMVSHCQFSIYMSVPHANPPLPRSQVCTSTIDSSLSPTCPAAPWPTSSSTLSSTTSSLSPSRCPSSTVSPHCATTLSSSCTSTRLGPTRSTTPVSTSSDRVVMTSLLRRSLRRSL